MRPLRHSYANRTLGDGVTVVKNYQGPGARDRSRREHAVLSAVAGRVPVPAVLEARDGRLTMTFMRGVHGQELLDAGLAGAVLRACGTMLGRIHRIDPGEIAALPGPAGAGHVLVHGDYGPNNVLLDPAASEVTAVLLGEFFGAYGGQTPPWPARQAIMAGRCRSLLGFCRRQDPGGSGEAQWARRLAVTEAWTE